MKVLKHLLSARLLKWPRSVSVTMSSSSSRGKLQRLGNNLTFASDFDCLLRKVGKLFSFALGSGVLAAIRKHLELN